MSTVLWANRLSQGRVVSDESDKPALHKHADKLDSLCQQLGLPPFSALRDSTDARYNLDDLDLPPGMASTNDVMAAEGVWMAGEPALRLLQALQQHVVKAQTRFGLLRNDHDRVVAELQESIAFIQPAAEAGERVNFSVVM